MFNIKHAIKVLLLGIILIGGIVDLHSSAAAALPNEDDIRPPTGVRGWLAGNWENIKSKLGGDKGIQAAYDKAASRTGNEYSMDNPNFQWLDLEDRLALRWSAADRNSYLNKRRLMIEHIAIAGREGDYPTHWSDICREWTIRGEDAHPGREVPLRTYNETHNKKWCCAPASIKQSLKNKLNQFVQEVVFVWG